MTGKRPVDPACDQRRRNVQQYELRAVPSPSASVGGLAMKNEDLAALEACFRNLSDEHRHVIVAMRLIGQSHAEVAAEMGRSVDAVGMLPNRALARLARLMRTHGGARI
ncbi:MAG TPA: sigma-70 family RNA polymerase sigma factor [Planctomycetota bacterium]